MSHSIVSQLAKTWFSEYSRLAYWIARHWSRRLLDHRARDYSSNELEELAQDAVCRGYARFLKRCEREICGRSDRKRWVCQCVIRGTRDAIRAKSSFGSLSSAVAVRDDVMNRCLRAKPGFVHGNDDEKQTALDQAHYQPIAHAVQRWELEQLIDSELPAHLRPTAIYAACDFTHDESGLLQGVTGRTVRTRLSELREYLDPLANPFAVICSALESCLDKPRNGKSFAA